MIGGPCLHEPFDLCREIFIVGHAGRADLCDNNALLQPCHGAACKRQTKTKVQAVLLDELTCHGNETDPRF
ncbi:hypothetical protein Pla110_39810 [Polystyrenella longa]|uniref:Uncharacterized protein n=1 Tax=Polystyrenella longa TaxID=2528007 RepID=A0A518CSN3_9PLAN|nr:hypothetical protein Pla110_39810 [Polystyrenella longa]